MICPFGPNGSDIRKHSDTLFKHILEPVAKEAGYVVFRTIDKVVPGMITQQIIEELYYADLVIADISDSNPNVFYELALRHCVGKPVIHISDTPDKVPFDIKDMNVIKKRLEIGEAEDFKKEIATQIDLINGGVGNFDNPAYKDHPFRGGSPGAGGEYKAKWFEWKLEYANNIHEEWYKRQKPTLQKCIEVFMNDPSADKVPKGIPLRRGLAEYLAYFNASGGLVLASLSYLLDLKTSTSSGWANCTIPGQSGNSSSMAIAISGTEMGSGNNLEISIQFLQGPRTVASAEGQAQEIRSFNYTIKFTKDPIANFFIADFFHPDYPEEPKLLVGKSQLTLKS